MKTADWFLPLLLLYATSISGLENRYLNRFSCGDEPVPCEPEISAGGSLAEICQDLKLNLDLTSAELAAVLYYQVGDLDGSAHKWALSSQS